MPLSQTLGTTSIDHAWTLLSFVVHHVIPVNTVITTVTSLSLLHWVHALKRIICELKCG